MVRVIRIIHEKFTVLGVVAFAKKKKRRKEKTKTASKVNTQPSTDTVALQQEYGTLTH